MPIHAYECRACGKPFSTLVRGGETPQCPACGSVDLERQLSLIASPQKSNDEPAPMGCAAGTGGCAGPACPAFAGG